MVVLVVVIVGSGGKCRCDLGGSGCDGWDSGNEESCGWLWYMIQLWFLNGRGTGSCNAVGWLWYPCMTL